MNDKNGNPVNVGDTVRFTAVIISSTGANNGKNVTVKAASDIENEITPIFSADSKFFEKMDATPQPSMPRRARATKKAKTRKAPAKPKALVRPKKPRRHK